MSPQARPKWPRARRRAARSDDHALTRRARDALRDMASKARRHQPAFIEPCLPPRALKPPTGSEWLQEIKVDGWRVEAVKDGKRVRLFTRRGHDWTNRFGPVGKAVAALPAETLILDGELVAEDPHGRPDFGLLRRALKGEGSPELVYHAFDILHLDGEDTRPLRLLERKTRLVDVLEPAPQANVRLVESFAVAGPKLLGVACHHGFEGIVSKRRDAPYRSGASHDWLRSRVRRKWHSRSSAYPRNVIAWRSY